MLLGALEAGGTKMVCALGNEKGELLKQAVFKTRTPEETMPEMLSFFKACPLDALGVAAFGPLELNENSEKYGFITATPKTAWIDYPLLPTFRAALNVPVHIDTDVNGAALAEYRLGAARGLSGCLYVTIGTGVGGGLIVNGAPVHGLMHPEFGHILLRPTQDDPLPRGVCPYHEGCLEGLASGPAIEKRWGKSAKELPPEHPAWALEAEYLAQMCVNAMMTISPEKIILGGGVMHQTHLYPMIAKRTEALLNGYIRADGIKSGLSDYIVAPGLKDRAGILGALLLAIEAKKRSAAKA